jgi:hypothetical protein
MLFAMLLVPSLVMVEAVSAQSVPKPSVPEFTVRFVNASYLVTTINSYTGVDETELVSNNSIVITIANQLFDYSGYKLYYNVRVKPHFGGNWTEVNSVRTWPSSQLRGYVFSYSEYISDYSPPQSDSDCTIIAFAVVPTELYLGSGYDVNGTSLRAIPDGSQLDFGVEALVGHSSHRFVLDHALAPQLGGHSEPAVAYDGKSGWSSTKTVTIGESQTPEPTTPTPLPSEEPQQIGQDVILGVVFIVAIIIVGLGLLVYLIKRK